MQRGRRTSRLAPHTTHLASRITHHASRITHHASRITHHASRITHHASRIMKPKVLILCTGNSCRSHMAEGILRAAAGDFLEVHSAGSKPAGYVHPLAIRAMAEIG